MDALTHATKPQNESARPIILLGIVMLTIGVSLYFSLELVRLAVPVVTPAPIELSKTTSHQWVTFEERR